MQQAILLARQYDAVVANPPYMGRKFQNGPLKHFTKSVFDGYEKDIFSCFIVRNGFFAKVDGNLGFMSPFVWMFISTHEQVRLRMITEHSLTSLVQLEYSGFAEATVPVCAFTLTNGHVSDSTASFIRLTSFRGSELQGPKTLEAIKNPDCGWLYKTKPDLFQKIPGSPIAYWISKKAVAAFSDGKPLHNFAVPRAGMITGDNKTFIRLWHEVNAHKIGFGMRSREEARTSGKKWFPYQKGGAFRKWYGNYEFVVNWENDGVLLRTTKDLDGKVPAHAFNDEYIFQANVNWSAITSSHFSARITLSGCHFDASGSAAFPAEKNVYWLGGFLNSAVAGYLLNAINPTLNFQAWNIGNLPVSQSVLDNYIQIEIDVKECCKHSEDDWNECETSWNFEKPSVLRCNVATLRYSQDVVITKCNVRLRRLKELEEENNRLFIEAYGLQDELCPEVPDDQITLHRPERTEDIKRLLSYSIGCVMGRYSVDNPGLIYAQCGNEGFDPSKYKTFRADDDGIIPLLDSDWGIRDDAANRIFEFISVAWPKEHLDENLKFVAESLSPSNGEQPKDTIRRYLATGFYKHHMSMYKKRPIYWMFSSGKQRAFQCLVYLHRYNEGTLARMRTEYVIPLMGKMTARLEHLQGPPEQKGSGGEIAATSAVTVKRKLEKERDNIKKQLAELQAFDEKLRHYADLRINLDLDDGVKVNYGKFSDPEIGDILAEVKAICGTKDED